MSRQAGTAARRLANPGTALAIAAAIARGCSGRPSTLAGPLTRDSA